MWVVSLGSMTTLKAGLPSTDWITPEEYEKLSEKAKQEYSYYEWDEANDWYKVYNLIVDRVDTMLGYFCRWADYAIKDADLDERYPTADYVRLIVYRS